MPDPSTIYRVNPVIAIEDFGERSLALHCEELRFVELNTTARDLIYRLDGHTSLEQAAAVMAAAYHQPLHVILEDAQVILAQMAQLGIVEPVRPAAPEDRF